MSKDIRSFFTVLSKKTGNAPPIQKKAPIILDSDDDIVEKTPEAPKKPLKNKKRPVVIDSDSEDDAASKSKSQTPVKKSKVSEKKPYLKPVDIDIFNKPIKQSEVKHVPKEKGDKNHKQDEKKKEKVKKKKGKDKNTEIGVHGDKAFEKTLEDLDDDTDDTILLDNLDILDKTFEDAMFEDNKANKNTPTKEKKESADKKEKMTHSDKKEESTHKKANATSSVTKEEANKNTPKKAEKRPRKLSESITPITNKKAKLEQTDSGIEHEFEKWEKKRQSVGNYVAYLNRGGPRHHGEKEYPKGKPDCLKNLTFLRTGVLDSLEGEEFETMVTAHGGRVVHAVSKKVNYVVVGEQPGPSKLAKAKSYKIPEISEDEFLDLILLKSEMKPKYAAKNSSEDFGFAGSEEGGTPDSCSPEKNSKESPNESDIAKQSVRKLSENLKNDTKFEECLHKKSPKEKTIKHEIKENKKTELKSHKEKVEEKSTKQETKEKGKVIITKEESSEKPQIPVKVSSENLSWTDKYKPTNTKGIIGQQDANSNMNKLKKWLENWFKNQKPERKKSLPRPTPFNQFDGAYFQAALLSGPPGVGKTTTATLVAKELGFDIVEFNASDTRSKKLLHEEISQMMRSKTVAGFASGQNNINQKRVLLMDEVDGMAGNEDRGGIAELISFIKTASFPIICMCNNRDLPKMRTLTNYCYALKFGKPNMMQVRGAVMSICFKEGLNVKPDALARLITGTGCDIRQTLNHLSMWSASEKNLSAETVEKESKNSQKDVVFGAWDVIKKVFNKSENANMSLVDKARLFFYDYSFGPMFVQENYLTVVPECTCQKNMSKSQEILIRRQLAADCLSQSDLIESKIRSSNNWSLLESQSYFSTVLPSYYLSGTMGQVRFPQWFGKNSQRNKSLRIIAELHSHTRTTISGDKMSVRLDYAQPLLNRLITPLKEKQAAGIDDTLSVMKSYTLLRDDLTNLCDLMTSFQAKKKNPFDAISSSVKSALTRKYNKTMVLSFAPPTALKKKKGVVQEDFFDEEEEHSDDDETEDTIDTDSLIKVKNKNLPGGSKEVKASSSSIKKDKKGGKTTKTSKKSKE